MNLDGQTDALNAAGCEKIFADTASGKLAERPELTLCLGYLRAGGTPTTHPPAAGHPC
jgi:DNA invertase Pin-like site-specific DNA recombinase